MADKEAPPIQHVPVHQRRENRDEVFDPRHPAATSYAVMQPAAGVVADDVERKGQNLAGGPTASEANAANMDQREILLDNYERDLRHAAAYAVQDEVEPLEMKDGNTAVAPKANAKSSSSSSSSSKSDTDDNKS